MNNLLTKNLTRSLLTAFMLMLLWGLMPLCAQHSAFPWMTIQMEGETSYVEVMKAYDRWTSDPANLQQKGWKFFGRWIEVNRSRLNPDGTLPAPEVFLQELPAIMAAKASAERMKSGQGWSPVGPDQRPPAAGSSPIHGMGRVNCIEFHPTDPDIYWIGVAQGGVWNTVNGGDSYFPLTDHLPILRISDIAVNPRNTDQLAISVGDYAYMGVALNTDGRKRNTHYGIGVYLTQDGGTTWTPSGLTFEQTGLDATLIRGVRFHPTEDGVMVAAGFSGIWKTTDNGEHWNQIRTDLIWDFEQCPTDGAVLYASQGFADRLGMGNVGLLKSIDFGETWTSLPTGMPDDGSITRVEIGLTPETPDYVYLVAVNPAGGFYGLYRTTDGGTTWIARNTLAAIGVNLMDWYQGTGNSGQGYYDLAIQVDPRDKEKVYVGGVNMWGSEDGGQTWSPMTYWVMTNGFTLHADHHQFKYNPADQKFYACHDGGVARTSELILGNWSTYNQGNSWPTHWEERSNGMIITSFYRIGVCDMFPAYIVGGAQDNATFYNKNGSWVNILGGDGMDCMINPDNPEIVYASSQYGSISRSTDGGSSFRSIRATNSEDGEWTTPIVQDMNNPSVIFSGYGNVWKSINMGTSWTKISNFPSLPASGKPAKISALTLYPANSGCIYAAQRMHHEYNYPNSNLWVTFDGGSRWSNITEGLPDSLYFTSIAVDGNDSLRAWVTCGGFVAGQKVFMTTDGGATWQNQSAGLPNIPANSVVHQEGYGSDVLYLGTDAGIYYYTEESDAWELYSTNLPNVIISELEIHYPTKKLYAATFGRGIGMTDLVKGTSGIPDSPFANSRLTVYPNPAQGMINIDLQGITSSRASIQLVDISGREVYREEVAVQGDCLNRTLNPELTPGLYFVRIWSGLEHRTAKVLVQ
ncbi:MAG: T9SS type A sorting domain-containing protein [Bacteroidales bacterium]|nr:T9SS type A sorting domain-containing protein [Bacteroidales bacterium]